MGQHNLGRRAFFRKAGLNAAALLGSTLDLAGNETPLFSTAAAGQIRQDPHRLRSLGAAMQPFVPDAEVLLTAAEKWVQILPGAQTRVWGYEGQLLSGSGVAVQAVQGSYLGPILRVQAGKKVRIYFHNDLAEDSVVHPHGLRVPQDCDGHPMLAIGPGQTKIYDFQVIDRAGPYWFHPHPHMRTAEQVLMGLAGAFYVWDSDEEAAVPGTSSGANDVPVIIQDRAFDSNNQFLYQPNQMWGYLGDRILVNGKPNAAISLEPRAYRLRILNGSNARTYKLGWSNGMTLKVIGGDGGLLPAALSRSYVMLMPGERVDIWADFSSLVGKQVILRSLSFNPGGMGGGGGMGGSGAAAGPATEGMGGGGGCNCGGGMGSLAMGAAFNILTVNVGRTRTANPVLGPLPALSVRYTPSNVPNWAAPRPFTLDMRQMVWTINGRVFEMTAVADDEMVNLDQTMAWEWINNSPIPHPMHVHNVQFQVVQRTPPSATSSYNTISQGLVDSGWKDTVLVWPGERVKIAMTFAPYTGMYMYHCHILEHEDMTMMRNYMIMDSGMPGM